MFIPSADLGSSSNDFITASTKIISSSNMFGYNRKMLNNFSKASTRLWINSFRPECPRSYFIILIIFLALDHQGVS
jgi:hypothetical protein